MARDRYDDLLDGKMEPAKAQARDRFDDLLDGKDPTPTDRPFDPAQLNPVGNLGLVKFLDATEKSGVVQGVGRGLIMDKPQSKSEMVGAAIPSILGFEMAGPVGGAAAEAARQTAITHFSKEPRGVAGPMSQVAAQYFIPKGVEKAAPYVAAGTRYLGGKVVDAAEGALQYGAKNLGGVPEWAIQNVNRAGKFIGAGPEVGDAIAAKARGAINTAVTGLKNAYAPLVKEGVAEAGGKTFNLQERLGQRVLEIADEHGLMNTPGLRSSPGNSTFWKFAGQVDGLQNASAEQVYAFQKQLNGLAAQHRGTPLGVAFVKLQGEVRTLLGQELEKVAQGNASYAAGKALEDESSRLVNSNDLINYVNRAYKNPLSTGTKETLESVGQQVPEVADALGDAVGYQAGQAFTPVVRSLPQTGMGAGIGYVAGKAAGSILINPLALPGMIAGAASVSPRAYYHGLMGAQAARGLIPQVGDMAASVAPALAAGAVAQSPLQRFYRVSPAPAR